MHPQPILILGVPRSGTTWASSVLGAAPCVRIVHEPDNETQMPWALVAKARLGRFPLLEPAHRARAFELLWRDAFSGGAYPRRVQQLRRAQRRWSIEAAEAAYDPQRRLPATRLALALMASPSRMRGPWLRPLVKSVHAMLCADWLVDRFRPATLVVWRDPVEVVASWRSMGSRGDRASERLEYAGRPARVLSREAFESLSERYGPPPPARVEALGWLAGALMSELASFAKRHREAVVLDFDAACASPSRALSAAADGMGLRWVPACEARLATLNRAGEGWELARLTASVPGAWRRSLEPAAIAEIEGGLMRFELSI